MSGLVAVIDHQAADPSVAETAAALASCYKSLHGETLEPVPGAAAWAGVAASPGAATSDSQRWRVMIGRAHADAAETEAPLGDLDGQFALIRGDDASVEVAVDPFGMQALYVAQAHDRTYVSTSVLTLARHLRARPDPLGVLTFLRTGSQFGRLTAWERIERLDPATALRFTPAGRSQQVYWTPRLDPSLASLDLAATAERCTAALTVAARERLGSGDRWADLTGGFDSRLLCLAMHHADVAFDTVTAGDDGTADVRIARAVAALADWRWTLRKLPDDWTEQAAALVHAAVAWGGGNLDALDLAEVLSVQNRNGQTHSALINGGGGEHLRHYASAQEFLRAGRSTEVDFRRFVALRMLPPEDVSPFRQDPTPSVRADLERRMRERAAAWSGARNTTQLDILYAYKSMGHFGAYLSAARGALPEMELPFYWKDVFTNAISARDRYRTQHRLQREMIGRLDPAIARLPTQRGGPAEPWRLANLHRFAPYYGRQAYNLASRLVRSSRGRPAAGLPLDSGAARRRIVATMADRGQLGGAAMRSAALYDPTRLQALVSEAVDPGFGGWSLLGRIITTELAMAAADAGF